DQPLVGARVSATSPSCCGGGTKKGPMSLVTPGLVERRQVKPVSQAQRQCGQRIRRLFGKSPIALRTEITAYDRQHRNTLLFPSRVMCVVCLVRRTMDEMVRQFLSATGKRCAGTPSYSLTLWI